MIAKAKTGSGFGGLARYLEAGSEAGDRVAWCEARHLPSVDPQLAARMMRATANRNDVIEKPVYHLSISFAPEDGATPALMRRVADRTLRDLGLQEHQALLVAHNDTAQPHVHIMVNRIHPETGKAWNNGHDFARLERSLRQQERTLGLREVPGHHHRLEGQQEPERTAPTTGQLRLAERKGERPFDERVRSVAGADFKDADSWSDLAERLDRHGLHLEKRGRGLVVTDGRNIVKGSGIARDTSLGALEKRFGPFDRDAVRRDDRRADPEREPERGPAAPPAERAQRVAAVVRQLVDNFQRGEALAGAVEAARWEVGTAADDLRQIRRQMAGAEREGKAFDQALAKIYQDPAGARRAFDGVAKDANSEKACQSLQKDPSAFGNLRGRSVLGMATGERQEATRQLPQLVEQARRLTTARRDAAAAFERLQPATQRHLAARSVLTALEERRRDEARPHQTAEQFRAALRAQVRLLGAEEARALALTIAESFDKRFGVEVQMAVKEVFRDQDRGKDKDRDVTL